MENAKILLVDDERSIVMMLEKVLRNEGFNQIFHASTAKEALQMVQEQKPDFIVLDVMLPDQSGFDICPKIRQMSHAHILFVTARASDLDILTGFATGGDDYVTKPFNPLEIAARIKARLRRGNLSIPISEPEITTYSYDFGRFIVNETAGELIVEGQRVSCPAQVFLLLLYLCKHPNRIFSKGQLYEAVWGLDGLADDNTVMVHIRRIREKIEVNPSDPKYLVTVRGLGYKLVKENRRE
ncbi:response regulator transcription factor [Brevibacillus laterosporus]|uniref:Transcriptional regulator n=2 Tax=Brevibacillus TaxID=55080 RepID=A0A0F6XZ14_BRELA|nr:MULTISPECIES: response regulator transcription factor [Brevibacillus]AKF92981.1 transcriptional regulator [Brevibacillus laterosporus]MCR8986797.1 response regulator transcription factor [Brevibacillus laterosporus]MCZ0832533.1 response regulator transcription factor [Brevibacillus halotolerans]GIO01924.1 transcriptional regulatory protein YvrH [Brevibacillus halotolerans]